jgi:autotransporter-associated beta strand protein
MADGTVINAGGGTITLSADETVTVGRLISTDITTAISITSVSGAINDAGDTGGSDLVATGGRAILTANDATNGAIGANVNGSLETELQSLTVSAGGAIGVNISQTGNLVATATANNGAITIVGTGTLTTDGNWSANSIDVDAAGTITVANNLTTDQASGVDLNTSSGSIVLNAGTTIDTTSNNGAVNLTSDDIDVNATAAITAGSAQVAFLPNNGRTTDIGATGGAGQYVVTDAELDRVTTTGIVRIGDAFTGNVVFTGGVTLDGTNTDTLAVFSGGSINDTGAGVVYTDTNLSLSTLSGDGIGTTSTLNIQVTNLAANDGSAGGIDITNTGDVVVGTVAGTIGVSTTTGATTLTSTGSITANEQIAADGNVTVDAATDFNGNALVNSLNGGITIGADNDIILAATGDITVTSGAGAISITADDDAVADAGSGGALTMADGAVVTANTGTISLSADENVTLGRLVTSNTTGSAISVTSVSGAIVDGGDTGGADVTAVNGTATLTANDATNGAIGAVADDLETQVATLIASAGGANGITIINNSNVTATLTANSGQAKLAVTGTLDTGGASSANSFDLDATGNVTVAHNITTDTAGGININSSGGTLTVNTGIAIDTTSNNGFVQLTSNDIDLLGTVNSGTASARLDANAGRNIDLGAAGSGDYILTDAEIDRITTAGDIQIFALGGNAVFAGTVSMANSNILKLTVTGTINDTGAAVVYTDTSLALDAGLGVGTTTPLDLQVTNFAATAAAGGVNVANTGNIDITDVAAISGITSTNGSTSVSAASSITVTSPISATGTGTVTLDAQGGDSGDVNLENTVTTAGGAIDVIADDTITSTINGDLTSNNGNITVTADDDSTGAGAVTMVDGTVFDSGTGTITVSSAGNVAVGRLVNTNTTATALSVTTSAGAITDAGDTGGADISTSGTAILRATDTTAGDIGFGNPLDMAAPALTLRAQGSNGANISQTGNLLANVEASTRAVTLAVAGTLGTNGTWNVESADVDATGNIALDNAVTGTAAGNLDFVSSAGTVTVAAAVNHTGAGGIVLDSQNGDSGDVNVNGSLTTGSGAITLRADNDVVGNASGTITTTSGLVTVTADDDGSTLGRVEFVASIDHGSNGSVWSTAEIEDPLNGRNAGLISGIVSGAGGLTYNGVGELRLSGANTYTGVTTINTGTIEVRSNAALGASGVGQGTTIAAAGELQFGTAFLTVAEPITSNAGTITTNAGIGVPDLTGTITFSGAGQTTINPGSSGTGLALTGQLTGTQGFTVDGSVFIGGNNSNDFAGDVNFLVGSLFVRDQNGLGSVAGSTTVNAGTELKIDAGPIPENIALAGIIRNDVGDNTLTGTLTLSGAATINVDTSTSLTVNNPVGETGGAASLTIALGGGSLILNGANTYTGATNVQSAGRLFINGSTTGSSAVTVTAAAFLGGSGTIGDAVTNNGTIIPGNSAGDLTVNDNVSFENNSAFTVEIGGTTVGTQYDQLTVNGTVTIGTGVTLTAAQLSGFVPVNGNQFLIIENDGADPVTGTFNGLAEGALISDFLGTSLAAQISYVGGTGNDVELTTLGPETSVTLVGNDLTVTDINASTDDTLTISTNGTNVVITDPSNLLSVSGLTGATGDGTNTITVPLTAFTGEIDVNTAGGDDSLTISLASGDFTRVVNYDGGAEGGGGDSMTISGGGTFADLTVNHTDLDTGSVVITGNSVFNYDDLEPITSTITATNVTLNFSTAAETITIASGGAGQTTVSSTAGESVTFANPTGTLTINAGDTGDDTINVQGVGSGFAGNLTINGGTGTDSVVFQTAATDIGAGTLSVIAETITAGQGITAGAVDFNATGAVGLNADITTSTAAGVDVNTSGGDISIAAAVTISSATGNGVQTYTSNDIAIDPTASLTAGSGIVSLIPNSGRTIDLGGSGLTTGSIYFTRNTGVRKADLDGGNPVDIVSGEGQGLGIAIDTANSLIYFVQNVGGNTVIRRDSTAGGATTNLFTSTGLNTIIDVEFDATNSRLYWTQEIGTDSWNVRRGDISGGSLINVTTLIAAQPGTIAWIALDIPGDRIYLTLPVDSGTDTIKRSALDGTGLTTIINTINNPHDIELDLAAGKLYVVERGVGEVYSANLDGTGIALVKDLDDNEFGDVLGLDLDVDGDRIYVASLNSNANSRVVRFQFDGSDQETLSSVQFFPADVAVDATTTVFDYVLVDNEFDTIATTSRIVVGNANSGNVQFSEQITLANADTLEIVTGGTINDTNASTVFTDTSLALNAAMGVGTTSELNVDVSNLAATAAAGGIDIRGGTTVLAITTVGSVTGLSATNGNVDVTANADVTISQPVSATGAGTVLLGASRITGGPVSNNDLALNSTVTTQGGLITLDSDSVMTFTADADVTSNGGNIGAVSGQMNFNSGPLTMADGTVIDAGSGTITIGATRNFTIGRLVTTNATASAIFVSGRQIVDGGDTGGADISAPNGTVTLAGSSIGEGNPLETEMTTASLTASAQAPANGHVEIVNTGNLVVNSLICQFNLSLDNTGTLASGDNWSIAGLGINPVATVTATGDITFNHIFDPTGSATTLTITSSGGNVIFGAGADLRFSSNNENVTVTANDVSIDPAAILVGDIFTLKPNTGRTIDIGATGGSGQFVLTDAELDRITAASRITIGDAASGNVVFTGAVDMANSATLLVTTGGTINDAGATDTYSDTNLALNAALGIGTTSTLNLATSNFAATAAAGGVDVSNTGNIDITTVAGIVGLTSTAANASVTAASSITVSQPINVTSTGTLLLDAQGGDSGDITVNAAINGGSGGVTLRADDDITSSAGGTIDALVNPNTLSLIADDDSSGSGTLTLAGNIDVGNGIVNGNMVVSLADTDGTISAQVRDVANFTKQGAGTLTTTGLFFVVADIRATAGRLNFNGTSNTVAATVTNGGTLGGTGTITGLVTVENGGTLSPGESPGILNVNGVTHNSGSTFEVEIGGVNLGNTANDHDQLNVTGAVSLGSATLSVSLFGGFSPTTGQTFTIINNDASDVVTGTFNGLAEGGRFAIGNEVFSVSYVGDTGNDVVLTSHGPTTTTVSEVGNDLQIEDTDGANTNDTLTISTNGTNVVITDPSNLLTTSIPTATGNLTNTITVPLAEFTGGINFLTQAGDDSLTVSLASGNFSRAISNNAGTGTNSMSLSGGGTFTTVTHTFTNDTDGTIDVTGNSQISYQNLAPITDNLSATNRVFTFNGGAETITVADDDTGGNNISTIDSTLGEIVTFLKPVSSMTINAGTGADTINISGIDSGFDASLTVNGDTGTDSFNLSTGLTFAASNSLTIDVDEITFSSASADVVTSGSGSVALTADRFISLTSGSSVSTVDGGITLSANSAGAQTADFIGIEADNAMIQTTGTGAVQILGNGAETGGKHV